MAAAQQPDDQASARATTSRSCRRRIRTTRCSTAIATAIPKDKQQHLAARWASRRRSTTNARSAVRGGVGRVLPAHVVHVPHGHVLASGRFSDSFTVNFPTNNVDPGPRAGQLPDRSAAGQRAGREPRGDRRDATRRARASATAAPCGSTIRIASNACRAVQHRLRAADRQRRWASQRRLHPLRAARPVRAEGAQPAGAQRHARDQHDARGPPARRRQSATGPPASSRSPTTATSTTTRIQVSGTKRYAQWLAGAHVVCVLARARQHADRTGATRADSQFLGDLNLDDEIRSDHASIGRTF